MMRSLTWCLWVLVLGALTTAAPCAGAPAEPVSPAPGSYVFGPGDVIDISIPSHSGYDRTMTIQPDGHIHFPLAGEIAAAGLTSAQLAARIRKGLSAELVDPRVTVSLKELNHGLMRRVSVLGEVKAPGSFELKEKSTLAELLAMAGGPQPYADLSRITITHADRHRVEIVDFSRAAQTGNVQGDIQLESGDLIIIPPGAPPTVLVLGEVTRPGSYPIESSSRIMDAVSLAGGPTPRAGLSEVRLTRAGQTRILDPQSGASDSRTGGSEAPKGVGSNGNVLLQAGDVVTVPEDENRVFLIGEVAKPDSYPLRPGDHLLDLLTRAGGPTRDANTEKAVLIRRDGNGQPEGQPLDLTRLLTKGDMRKNLALQPGDVIVLPNKGQRTPSTLRTLLVPFTGLLGVLMRVTRPGGW
jgi:protein involved in polysaccharide export with SLBB domain